MFGGPGEGSPREMVGAAGIRTRDPTVSKAVTLSRLSYDPTPMRREQLICMSYVWMPLVRQLVC